MEAEPMLPELDHGAGTQVRLADGLTVDLQLSAEAQLADHWMWGKHQNGVFSLQRGVAEERNVDQLAAAEDELLLVQADIHALARAGEERQPRVAQEPIRQRRRRPDESAEEQEAGQQPQL